jgi:two-component system response regulator MprA
LIVEGDPEIGALIRSTLHAAGYSTRMAAAGAEALQAIALYWPALIILDENLPEVDGDELMDVLNEWDIAPPVLVITGDPHGEEWAEEIGAAAFLAKPFEVEQLLDRVRASTA